MLSIQQSRCTLERPLDTSKRVQSELGARSSRIATRLPCRHDKLPQDAKTYSTHIPDMKIYPPYIPITPKTTHVWVYHLRIRLTSSKACRNMSRSPVLTRSLHTSLPRLWTTVFRSHKSLHVTPKACPNHWGMSKTPFSSRLRPRCNFRPWRQIIPFLGMPMKHVMT